MSLRDAMPSSGSLKQSICAATISLAAALAPVPATAQTDIFSLGRELLRNLPGLGDANRSLLSEAEISAGLREALRVGTATVVRRVGRTDGYYADPAIHVPLPDNLAVVRDALSRVGMGRMMQDLELRLNRAAEAAAPEAQAVFWDAISQMTLDDVRGIYDGPDDAATRYFQRTMTPDLISRMRPIVDRSLADVGALRAYDEALGRYRALPFVPDVRADLTEHVIAFGLDGLFLYLAREEQAIRHEPAKRTTEILRKVFSR